MRKFKLIKNYFDSGLKVGFEITFPDNKTIVEYYNGVYILQFNIKEVEKYPENWQEIIDKNYEILSFRNNEPEGFRMYTKLQRDGSYTCDGSVNGATEKWCFDEGYKIHSVKRLSDGEVFTIGDSTNRGIIEKINAIDRTICINQYVNSFKDLQHIKKPLFTTEDGVDIFNITDKYYMISNWSILPQTFDITTNNKHFSTKEAAEEYILRNKPCLSVNDICKMVEKVRGNDSFNDSNFNKDLVKLVKKKLDYDN